MNTTQIALGSITFVMVGTLSFLVAVDRMKVETYTASMMGVLAVWLKVDTDGNGKPDIIEKTTLSGSLPGQMLDSLAQLKPRPKL